MSENMLTGAWRITHSYGNEKYEWACAQIAWKILACVFNSWEFDGEKERMLKRSDLWRKMFDFKNECFFFWGGRGGLVICWPYSRWKFTEWVYFPMPVYWMWVPEQNMCNQMLADIMKNVETNCETLSIHDAKIKIFLR